MCVDFTDLNKACPKDSFPLPRMDVLIDSTSGHELLSFMDAFSGYNQIQMSELDEEKTFFITNRGLYCYNMMPFGLKNAGATYQRPVNKMFGDQIGRNVEVYVDDMLVKSRKAISHLVDLEETFNTLRRISDEVEPDEMCFRCFVGKVPGIHGFEQRDRSESGENSGCARDASSPYNKTTAAIDREDCSLEPVHFSINGQMFTLL